MPPIETLDRSVPPSFNRGLSPLARLVLLCALALFLMVADARFHVVQPLRAAIATVLYPAQWLALQPVQWAENAASYMTDLKTARKTGEAAQRQLLAQSQRAGQVEQLMLENARLRGLLKLEQRVHVKSHAAQVLYDATDPFSRRVVINKGRVQGIEDGSSVIDGAGVVGQVTQVYPLMSEITLLTDRNQVIPVLNARTGVRSVAYGDSSVHGNLLELRYVAPSEDVRVGDLLTTSGIDGVYPPGLPVAQVVRVDAQGDAGFAHVECQPVAALNALSFVMVLDPVSEPAPPSGMGLPALTQSVSKPAAPEKPAAARRSNSKAPIKAPAKKRERSP
ncbi:MAG: rod shape-determining protein MreC [Burkholderiaceae bacterium]|nr:MAG: rod shape-determining protein MreC [Burkholderiaceae bacterium]